MVSDTIWKLLFLAGPTLVLVKMVTLLWCVHGLHLNYIVVVRRITMERKLNKVNFLDYGFIVK